MKIKNILSAVCFVLVILVYSSCEDMFKVDSKIVLYDYENTLDNTSDTVYSVLGIIKDMQKIADRAVILGEIRGDLVSTSERANKDLAELYNYDYQNLSKSNRYNNPTDYYKVINDCNFFLSKVDTSYTRNNKKVFEKEYVAVLSFRAWTYLQLAQIYGNVYFSDKPILSDDQAVELKKAQKLNIKQIAAVLLGDFEERFINVDTPDYGSLDPGTTGDGRKPTTHTSKEFFIPVRLIMGDLALWAEDYGKAALYYHDYLSANDMQLVQTGTARITWLGYNWNYLDPQGDSYSRQFGNNMDPICYIPMEIDEYNGIVSDLPNIFNSVEDNDFWYQLTSSKALVSLSTRQYYCYHYLNEKQRYDYYKNPQSQTYKMPTPVPYYQLPPNGDKNSQDKELLRGDLRLQAVLSSKSRTVDEYTKSNESLVEQKLIKINNEKICLYRNDVVYLRLAEALNRAGMPQMAFAILKSGLCGEVIEEIKNLSPIELDRAKVYGIDYTGKTPGYFAKEVAGEAILKRVKYDLEMGNKAGDVNPYTLVARSISGERGDSVYSSNIRIISGNTMGIHSRGCGDANIDTLYTIGHKLSEMGKPRIGSLQDSILAVEEYIIDEMGLETCFEGYRFGDLMRIAQHRANGSGYDTEFLAERVASRSNATMEDPYGAKDNTLFNRLKESKNWFLPLPGE